MIKKLFTNQSKTITGAAIILGAASFVSRIIGILRDRIFTHLFGAGETLDAYYAAFRIPDFVYTLIIVGAISAGFIPIFTKLLEKDKKEAWRVTNSLINILGLCLLVTSAILFLFAPQIMNLLAPGFSASAKETAILLTRIMLINPAILGISSIVSGVIQSFKAFFIYSLAPIVYNLGIIIGAVFLVPIFGLKGLAIGVILGTVLNLLIQLPTLYHNGYKYEKVLDWKNKNVLLIWKLMIPRTLSLAVSQINLVIITALASTIEAGSIAVFNLANNIQYFPIGVFGISFAIAAFPTLAQFMAQGKKTEMTEHITTVIRQILFFIIPLSVIFLLLRSQIIRVVFGSGAFNWPDTIRTANTLAFFTLSLFAQALIPLLIRVYFVLQDTWTPFLSGLIGVFITILSSMYLKSYLGISGLAFGFSLGMIAQLVTLWVLLRHKLGTLHELKLLHFLYKTSLAAICMSVVLQYLKTPLANIVDMTRFWGIFTQGAVAGTAGVIIYFIICYILRVEEIIQVKQSFTTKFLKLKPTQAEVKNVNDT